MCPLRTAPPSAGHCLGTTEPGGWRDDSAGERCDPAGHPQGVPLRSSGIGSFKGGGTFLSPVFFFALQLGGRTTRRGDPCGRPPPNGATVRRPLLGHYRTGGVARRLSRGTMRPRRAPTRGAPTVIGDGKFQTSRNASTIGAPAARLQTRRNRQDRPRVGSRLAAEPTATWTMNGSR